MASTYSSPPSPTDGAAGAVAPSAEPGVFEVPVGPSLAARLGAEAFGTFGLVFVILGGALYLPVTGAPAGLGVPLAAGLVLAGLIAALGHISGGHFNPAVSLGAALAGRLAWLDLVLYWVAQVVGGIAAAAILYVTIPSGVSSAKGFFSSTVNGWGELSPLSTATQGAATFDLPAALILEAVATAVFVAVTIGVVHRRAAVAVGPFAVGLTLAAMLLVTGLATGGGLNPARSTAAALFARGDSLGQLWLFWLAPLLGAAIVGLFALAFTPATVVDDDDLYEDEDDDVVDDTDDVVDDTDDDTDETERP